MKAEMSIKMIENCSFAKEYPAMMVSVCFGREGEGSGGEVIISPRPTHSQPLSDIYYDQTPVSPADSQAFCSHQPGIITITLPAFPRTQYQPQEQPSTSELKTGGRTDRKQLQNI